MLSLNKIQVKGFRNINSVSLKLNKMNALVGLNSSGKSNVLDAIQFGFMFIAGSEDLKHKLMRKTDSIPINTVTQNLNYFFEIDGEIKHNNQTLSFKYGYEFVWSKKKEKRGEKIVGEWLKSKEQGAKKYSTLINRKENKSLFKSSKKGRCDNPVPIAETQLLINKLEAFDDLFYIGLINEINQIATYIERKFDTAFSYIKDPLIPRYLNESDIGFYNNIPRAMYYLKRDYKEKYDLLIDAYTILFPNLRNIYVEKIEVKPGNLELPEDAPFIVSESMFSMYVEDKTLNQPIDFNRLSNGCKRVFLMFTYAVWAEINNLPLIAFEEPENSVHPALMQDYLSILSQLSGDTKIILTSHSPHIIECVNPQAIYVSTPCADGVALFRRFANKKVKQLFKDTATYSNSAGGYIFELLSGTEEDHLQLAEYLEK